MNVFGAGIAVSCNEFYPNSTQVNCDRYYKQNMTNDTEQVLSETLNHAEAPVILIGGGVKPACADGGVQAVLHRFKILVISAMISFDVMKDASNYYGFLGAYGSREGNFIAAKSDLVITIGSRLDIRQVGVNREAFAPHASIIRCDVDASELEYRVHEDEIQICAGVNDFIIALERVKLKPFDN